MISTVGVDLPTGWVTFLFTDIEGSTRLIEELGEDGYVDALGEHHRVLRTAFAAHGGVEVGTQGDAFLYAFTDPGEGLAAAGRGQQALASGPVRVRMGLHTGQVRLTREGDDYTGREVHRAARIAAAGHGGQVVVSETTAALVDGTSLRDLGPHRLKDLLEPIRLHQLVIAGLPCDFPPLRSLHRTNLPLAAWPLLGRALELRKIGCLVSGGARLVTLTGPGGSGKTRLALQAAAELSDEFPDGVFWVGLASVRDRIAVRGTVAEAVGLQADAEVAAWLESRRALLVLDNLEHLAGIDATVADLLVGETTILATSRTPLRLTAERELPIEPLLEDAAIELFVSRAAAAGRPIQADDTVAAVCRRLDNLPLALELAAAKSKLLSPAALLQRLDSALPLLTGGASDRPERQRTLRATIEWSHDLLATDARTAFRRLSVFRGSFTLDAAEAVTGANLDQVAALLDQSLLKPLGDERFFLLETLGEYGRERLDGAGERDEYALRHARYYLTQLKENETAYDSPRRAELLAWFGEEEDNFRAMLDRLSATVPADAAVAADLLKRYWVARGAYSEARDRLQNLLALTELATDSRGRLLAGLSEIEEWMGHLDAAEAAGREAVELAEAADQSGVLFGGLRNLAWIADRRGDGEQAVRLQRRALEVAASIDERTTALALHDLGTFLTSVGRRQEAREALQLAAERARAIEYESLEVDALASVGRLDLYARDFDAADRSLSLVFARGRARELTQAGQRVDAGYAALGLDRRGKAIRDFADATERMIDAGVTSHYDFSRALAGIALAAGPADARRAGCLYGATKRLRECSEFRLNADDADLERFFEQPFIEALGIEAWEHEQATGAALALHEAIALARSLAAHHSGAYRDQQAETLGLRPS